MTHFDRAETDWVRCASLGCKKSGRWQFWRCAGACPACGCEVYEFVETDLERRLRVLEEAQQRGTWRASLLSTPLRYGVPL